MSRILIVGCGRIGLAVADGLSAAGHEVLGLRRNPPAAQAPLVFLQADLCDLESLKLLDTDFDQVLYVVAPDRRDEAAYRAAFETGLKNIIAVFKQTDSQAAFTFISSTSVYGQCRGEWITESSESLATNYRARALIKAESLLLEYQQTATVIRFAGIYGPKPGRLLSSVKAGMQVQCDPPLYTNRIHFDDCVSVIAFILQKKIAGQALPRVILASDDAPATRWDVTSYLAGRMQLAGPSPIKLAVDAEQNKRCDNRSLKRLGYEFIYPSFKEGYAAVLEAATSDVESGNLNK